MKIVSKRILRLDSPVPVYDITVPETENFALAAGPIVHNSKDVADALAGVHQFLLTRRAAWTARPDFIGEGGYTLFGNRTYEDKLLLPRAPSQELDRTKPKRGTSNRRPAPERRSSAR